MRFFLQSLLFLAIGSGLLYVYLNYGDALYQQIFGDPAQYTILVNTVGVSVTFADTPEERRQGLSGTEPLGPLEGKLFLFDDSDRHGIWMKDMNYSIDILWIDEELEIAHIEESVSPETYPQIFRPVEPARYVLETSAQFVNIHSVEVGQRVSLPPSLIPADIKAQLSAEYVE